MMSGMNRHRQQMTSGIPKRWKRPLSLPAQAIYYKSMRLISFLSLTLVLSLPVGAAAQSLDASPTAPLSFTVSVNPQYPAPYSQATISFLSSTIDLATAEVAVSVNGKSIYRGSVHPLAVSLGEAGSITSVSATMFVRGASYNQTLSIQPQDVVLVVEPIASAPPLYAGKPSVPLGGNVRIVAMANMRGASGAAADPSSFSYSWTVDGMQVANASGIGKDAIVVISPLQYRGRSVSVSVTNRDGTLTGGASLSFSASEPVVRIYENDPLLGIRYERALSGSYSILGSESTLYAAPFHFPTAQRAPLLEWFLNGEVSQTGNFITLRPTGSGKGSASLSLVASSGDSAKATASLSLSFGTTPSFNLFGL